MNLSASFANDPDYIKLSIVASIKCDYVQGVVFKFGIQGKSFVAVGLKELCPFSLAKLANCKSYIYCIAQNFDELGIR